MVRCLHQLSPAAPQPRSVLQLAVLVVAALYFSTDSSTPPPRTDYCALLGGDDIQGKKSGFLTGNKVYYIGGKYEAQKCTENETIGLTHPFYHDLRSRGTGIATYKGVGTGNDFDGWEFHRATEVAAGSIVTPDITWRRPAPKHMFWRPDKMVAEYELSNPFLAGVYDGWCSNWTQLPGSNLVDPAAAWKTMIGYACNIGKAPLFTTKVAGPKGSPAADSQCQRLCESKPGCVEWQLSVASMICWGYNVHSTPGKNENFDCGCQGDCGLPPSPAPGPAPSPSPPHGGSFWTGLTESECWAHCNNDTRCSQAVFEVNGGGQCWTGANSMTELPASSRSGCTPAPCVDKCFAKGKPVPNVTIKEEKFIAANDVVSTTITSDSPVMVEISGRSFAAADNAAGKVISLHGQCSIDKLTNSVHIVEGGTVSAHVQNVQASNGQQTPVYATGKLMYDGMTGIISASRPMVNASTYTVDPKPIGRIGTVCGYTFYVPVDSRGTTISWVMHDQKDEALKAVHEVLADPASALVAKTKKMNDLLNEVVPYFRCGDDSIVKVYYYLWSLYLMYFTQGDRGMQAIPHTQTAVNNFLGMHRYDAMFQILVGSWTNPAHHDFYANGNVLAWSQLLPYRRGPALPDNFGIDWASGCYGGEMIVHVIGACQIYEHSGNRTFLNLSYAFYKELFWDDIGGTVFGYAYDSVLCLNKMASVLGYENDTAHWNASVQMDTAMQQLNRSWQVDTPNMFGSTKDGMGFSNIATAGIQMFPREWVVAMAENWMDDSVKGFYTAVPLARTALKDWATHDPGVFAVVPDANWFMIRALYRHQVDNLANKFLLGHLKQYNMEWGGIPVAPEGRDTQFKLFGDQYSNFNAGKILLLLEGVGGLAYSTEEDSFTFADNLPTNWTFMEFRVPVIKSMDVPFNKTPPSPVEHGAAGATTSATAATTTWVVARVERQIKNGRVTKAVTVDGSPFATLKVQPWAEDARVINFSPAGATANVSAGHVSWELNASSAHVVLTLDAASAEL